MAVQWHNMSGWKYLLYFIFCSSERYLNWLQFWAGKHLQGTGLWAVGALLSQGRDNLCNLSVMWGRGGQAGIDK